MLELRKKGEVDFSEFKTTLVWMGSFQLERPTWLGPAKNKNKKNLKHSLIFKYSFRKLGMEKAEKFNAQINQDSPYSWTDIFSWFYVLYFFHLLKDAPERNKNLCGHNFLISHVISSNWCLFLLDPNNSVEYKI